MLALGAVFPACNCNPNLQQHNDFDSGPTKPVCGNGKIEGTEQCDGTNFGGQTCVSLGFISGTLACTANTCQFDTSQCSRVCGDGKCDLLKECDGTNLCGAQCNAWGVYTCDASCHLVKTACVSTLFTVVAPLDLLSPPIVRFGKSVTASWDDLALAVPGGDPGPIVEIERFDPTATFKRDRTLGLSTGFSPPFLYKDVNGDGYTDALVASANGTTMTLHAWDNANGLFQEYDAPLGCTIDEYALGDLNEDGKPDVVVACGSPAQTIGVVASGQTPPYSTAAWLAVNEPVEGIQVLDVDGDGHADIVFRRSGTNALGILAGNGKAVFTARPDSAVGNVVGRPTLVDLDLDKILDLVVVDSANLQLHLYPGVAGVDGGPALSFGTPVNLPTIGIPVEPRVVDLDLDGLPDIAFASQPASPDAGTTVAALKNLGSGGPSRFNFQRQDTAVSGIGTFTTFDVGDFDQDGDLDAAAGGSTGAGGGGTGQVVFLQNNVH